MTRPYITYPYLATGGTAARTSPDRWAKSLHPEDFVATAGTGGNDTSALLAWAAACNASGALAELSPNKSYNLSSASVVQLMTSFRGNGSEIVTTNDGQNQCAVSIESLPADRQTVSLAIVNSWTGLYRGSTRIPQLTERGWNYFLTTTDTNWLLRSTGTPALASSATFTTTTDAGDIAPELIMDLPEGAFTQVTATRHRIRHAITIDGLKVRYSGGTGTSSVAVRIGRPNTTLINCSIQNDTTTEVFQGFAASQIGGLTYIRCSVDGLNFLSTNYGFGTGSCHDVHYIDCTERFCRRGIDAGGGQNIRVTGGQYPDGIGGHGIFGFYGDRVWLGTANASSNVGCMQASGSDIVMRDCTFVVTQSYGAAMNVRQDMPEMRGTFAMIGGKVILDDTYGLLSASVARVMNLNPSEYYDTERAVYMPDRIIVAPDSIEQLGSSSTAPIHLLSVSNVAPDAEWPQDIICEGVIDVAPGNIRMEAGPMLASGFPRLQVNLLKAFNQAGAGYVVRIRNIPCLTIYTPCAPGATQAEGRYDILAEDMTDVRSHLILAGSTIRHVRMSNSNPNMTVTMGAPTHPVGDESVEFEQFASVVRPPYKTVRFYATWEGAAGAAVVPAADTVYFYPFRISHVANVLQILLQVVTGGAGSSAKSAIYANSVISDRPVGAPLVADNVGQATATSGTHTLADVTDTVLQPGWYWAAAKFTGTLPTMVSIPAYSQFYTFTMGRNSTSPISPVGKSLADTYAGNMPTIAEGAVLTEFAGAGIPVLQLRAQ